jgi:hypothetical protein
MVLPLVIFCLKYQRIIIQKNRLFLYKTYVNKISIKYKQNLFYTGAIIKPSEMRKLYPNQWGLEVYKIKFAK